MPGDGGMARLRREERRIFFLRQGEELFLCSAVGALENALLERERILAALELRGALYALGAEADLGICLLYTSDAADD